MNKRFGLWLLLAGSVCLASAGAAAAIQEFRAFSFGGVTDASRVAALSGGDFHYAASPDSRRSMLQACRSSISGLYGRLQVDAVRNPVLTTCLMTAEAIASENPTDSFAWYISALAASEIGDVTRFNERLLQSQRTGPSEQWIAEMRVQLAEDHYDSLTPAVRAKNDDDLAMLVQSQRGIRSIARRYVGVPTFRERITQIVETLPVAEQRRFLSSVRSAAAQ